MAKLPSRAASGSHPFTASTTFGCCAQSLGASVGQIGLITAAGYAPWPLLTLPAGVYAARLPWRSVLVLADLSRALVVCLVPTLLAFGHLMLWHLYLSNVLVSCATVFYEVVYLSMPPRLLPRKELVAGNARLQVARAVAMSLGPAVAGLVVQLIGPGPAPLVNAAGFVFSASCTFAMRTRGVATPAQAGGLVAQLGEAFRFMGQRRILLSSMAASALGNCCFAAYEALVVVFLAKNVGVPAGVLGVLLGAAGAGSFLGALSANRVTLWLGTARAVWLPALTLAPAGLLLPMASRGVGLSLFLAGALLFNGGYALFTVGQATLVQLLTPPDLLQRMVASIRFVTRSMLFVGGLLGGLLGDVLGARIGMAAVMGAWLLAPAILATSRLRRVREATALYDELE